MVPPDAVVRRYITQRQVSKDYRRGVPYLWFLEAQLFTIDGSILTQLSAVYQYQQWLYKKSIRRTLLDHNLT